VQGICTRARLDWLVGSMARLAVEDLATGRFAGSVGVRLPGPPGVGGIGYAIHPAFRGRGYTGRALRLLVPWAFEAAGFARLELGAKADNIASQRAAAAGGFEPDGVRAARLRNPDGSYSDEVRYAAINPQTARRISP
jgi:RimJ/RimL family protein N-acetyltransferase